MVLDTNIFVSMMLGGHVGAINDAWKADPSDNKFIDAAIEANADFLVSGDNQLLDMQSFRDIPILTARQFIEQLTASQRG